MHPDWYFMISKYEMPKLKHKNIPNLICIQRKKK
jgi:hypothetical protein